MSVTIEIEDDILHAARMTPDELKQELALLLFQQDRLTLGQAANLAGLNQLAFQRLLASRQIAVHYDVDDLETDIANLRTIGQL